MNSQLLDNFIDDLPKDVICDIAIFADDTVLCLKFEYDLLLISINLFHFSVQINEKLLMSK